MESFKIGQAVLVAEAFANGAEGFGIVKKKLDNGNYKVALGENVLEVEQERLKDAESEYKRRREEFLEKNPKFKVKW